MSDEPVVIIPFDKAVSMLPDKDSIHTFRQGGIALIGADWERKEILSAFQKYPVELTGPIATSMNHGLAFQDNHGYVFVETKAPKEEE